MNRSQCAAQARAWLAAEPLFLDTETTGPGPDDEICQIAIVDHRGNVVLESLVRPSVPIGAEAQRVHGITDEMVAGAPTFTQLRPAIDAITFGRDVVIYNSDFDIRMMAQAEAKIIHTGITYNWAHVCDAMFLYADFYGDIHPYYGTARWQKLGDAAAQCGIAVDGALHGARVDAETTRRIVMHMAEYREAAEGETTFENSPTNPLTTE